MGCMLFMRSITKCPVHITSYLTKIYYVCFEYVLQMRTFCDAYKKTPCISSAYTYLTLCQADAKLLKFVIMLDHIFIKSIWFVYSEDRQIRRR